jgi:hypothetical protein
MIRRSTRWSVFASTAVVISLLAPPGGSPVEASSTATLTITEAIATLPIADENRTDYDRELFRLWVDADGNGCNTRYEVLIEEADDPPSVGSRCRLSGGRWFSYYDRVSWTNPADIDIDHVVALAEAWDSGASQWSDERREAYANDLGDHRTLVGVTDSVNQSKSDQDPAEWLPEYDRCRYLADWLAVKVRWQLSADTGEVDALGELATTCADETITVEIAG